MYKFTGFRGYDPFEDTESSYSPRPSAHGPCFRGYDPFEDTESVSEDWTILPSADVSGATIRLRILKVELS